MLMADVLMWALLIAGFIASFQGLWLMCSALWPCAVGKSGWIIKDRPKRAFGVGLVAGAVWIVAIMLVAQLGPVGQFLAFGVFCVGFLFLSCGVSALATMVGEGLLSPADRDRPWKATLRGGVAMGLVYPLPVVGWFLVLPGSMVLGMGAMVMGWWVKGQGQLKGSAPVAQGSELRQAQSPAPIVQGPGPQESQKGLQHHDHEHSGEGA